MYLRIIVFMEDDLYQTPALEHALKLAKATGGHVSLIWLVTVIASQETFFSQVQIEEGSSGARRKARGEAFLEQAVQPFRQHGVQVEAKVVVTAKTADQEILDTARTESADLILLANLPQSAIGRFLFGSVSEKVLRRSPIPVLFISPGETPEEEA